MSVPEYPRTHVAPMPSTSRLLQGNLVALKRRREPLAVSAGVLWEEPRRGATPKASTRRKPTEVTGERTEVGGRLCDVPAWVAAPATYELDAVHFPEPMLFCSICQQAP